MPISDTPMTYLEFRAIRAQVLRELKLRPTDWITLLAGNIDSAGQTQELLNTSGQVTEASAGAIYTNTLYSMNSTSLSNNKFFSQPDISSSTACVNGRQRLFQQTVTATAGGEIATVAVGPPALAGYQCCMVITHIWSDQTDGSINLAWSSTGGLTVGLATTNIATTANQIAPDWSPGLAWKATADNDTIDVAAAAGQCGASQVIVFAGFYWYET